MDLFGFLAKVIVISLSGALAPGPLTASTATLGAKRGWKAGFLVSVGHMLVELPLVVAVSLGVFVAFTSSPESSIILGLVGGSFLIFFGVMMGKDAPHADLPTAKHEGGLRTYSAPLGVGVTLSAFNPYFIIWWIGVGAPLILEALSLGGFPMLGIFYASHVWLDFVWLSFIASIASLSRVNPRYYRIVLGALSVMVFIFGVDLILRVTIGLSIIPL
nr:LysE family transporter [Candidatus Njordarchaeota archaeon]